MNCQRPSATQRGPRTCDTNMRSGKRGVRIPIATARSVCTFPLPSPTLQAEWAKWKLEPVPPDPSLSPPPHRNVWMFDQGPMVDEGAMGQGKGRLARVGGTHQEQTMGETRERYSGTVDTSSPANSCARAQYGCALCLFRIALVSSRSCYAGSMRCRLG